MSYTDRSINMKIALLFALVAVAAAMEGFTSKQKFIDGQFIIRIDESMTKTQVHEFSSMMEKKFKICVVKSYNLKSAKFLFVKGEYTEVMKAKSLSGVKSVQRNMIHSIQCTEGSASGCWGLDRTDQVERLSYSDPLFDGATYVWGDSLGSSTVAYIADTGIDVAHDDFGGRAVHGYTAGEIPTDGDGNGHGTHCAGTVGSDSYGIAKAVQLVAVKVLRDSGFGSTNGIIDGLEWIEDDHVSRGTGAKSVINMSLGGGADDAFDAAVASCVDAGIVVVAAAGNSDANACNSSPAREPSAVTVGATDVTDTSAWFTNYGECVDIFAPGVDVLSTTPEQTTSVFSGTSMAAPHVVGVVARYMDSLGSAPTPEAVSSQN